jgi:hypothetical protein
MRKSLKLSFGIHSIELFKFAEGGCKQTFEAIGDTVYGISGVAIDSGIQYESHRIYSIDTFLETEEKQRLIWLSQASERARILWNPAIPYAIGLEDFIHEYAEPGNVQTRANAIGSTVQIRPSGLVYPAKFKVRLSELDIEPVRANRTIHRVKFTMKETDRVNP